MWGLACTWGLGYVGAGVYVGLGVGVPVSAEQAVASRRMLAAIRIIVLMVLQSVERSRICCRGGPARPSWGEIIRLKWG